MLKQAFALGLLSILAACRTGASSTDDSAVKEATSKGFEYDNIIFDLVDVNGAPVPNVAVTFSSFHWSYELFDVLDFFPLPIFDPRWVEKKGESKVVAMTDANGHAESGRFAIKAKPLGSKGPSSFKVGYFDQLPKPCKDVGGLAGLYNVGTLSRISSVPDQPGNSECELNVAAEDDVYRVIELKCRSSRSVAEIEDSRQKAMANCPQD